MIRLNNVSKYYYSKGLIASGFSKVSIEFNIGEFVAIIGESGSGKSTLLNVISGLDTYEEGEMFVNGSETSHFTEKDLEEYRRKYVGNIFQNFNLVNSYTVYQNIELVLLLNGNKKKDIKKKVIDLIKQVDLYKFRNTKVSKLSGGQKQRVAIARALAKDTPLIIADEPTGNLDSKSAQEVFKVLHEISKEKLVIIVTHNFEQVEKYVTRVVKMHDGKILEDKVLKEPNKELKVTEAKFKNITFFNKIRLASRNTFNVFPKFVLMFLVYLFITFFSIQQYANYKNQQYDLENSGYNGVFLNTRNDRIVIKKKNNSVFTNDDYNKINKIKNVKTIKKFDLLLDEEIDYHDNKREFWLTGTANELSTFNDELIMGEMPKKNDEILVVLADEDFRYYDEDEIYEKVLFTDYSNTAYKVVGIATKKISDNIYGNSPGYDIYMMSDELENMYYKYLMNKMTIDFYISNSIANFGYINNVVPSPNVLEGEAYISSNNSYLCSNDNCTNKKLEIKVKEPNYNEQISLNISKVYNKYNFNSLTGYTDYEINDGVVFINEKDYSKIFKKGIYQSSVIVNDEHKIDDVVKKLDKIGIDCLVMKDTLINEGAGKVISIFYTIITIILAVSIFYISYFVISLILKSRNVYFSTIRILGANKKISKDLLILELLVDCNLVYGLYLLTLFLVKNNIIVSTFLKNNIFNDVITYLGLSDFIILYIILNVLSYLISIRFAKKLFKRSAITTLNEEV